MESVNNQNIQEYINFNEDENLVISTMELLFKYLDAKMNYDIRASSYFEHPFEIYIKVKDSEYSLLEVENDSTLKDSITLEQNISIIKEKTDKIEFNLEFVNYYSFYEKFLKIFLKLLLKHYDAIKNSESVKELFNLQNLYKYFLDEKMLGIIRNYLKNNKDLTPFLIINNLSLFQDVKVEYIDFKRYILFFNNLKEIRKINFNASDKLKSYLNFLKNLLISEVVIKAYVKVLLIIFKKSTKRKNITENEVKIHLEKLSNNLEDSLIFAPMHDGWTGYTDMNGFIYISSETIMDFEKCFDSLLSSGLIIILLHEFTHHMIRKIFPEYNNFYKRSPFIKEFHGIKDDKRDAGFKFEEIIFGGMDSINSKEADYILEINNWNKELNIFINEFSEIKKQSSKDKTIHLLILKTYQYIKRTGDRRSSCHI